MYARKAQSGGGGKANWVRRSEGGSKGGTVGAGFVGAGFNMQVHAHATHTARHARRHTQARQSRLHTEAQAHTDKIHAGNAPLAAHCGIRRHRARTPTRARARPRLHKARCCRLCVKHVCLSPQSLEPANLYMLNPQTRIRSRRKQPACAGRRSLALSLSLCPPPPLSLSWKGSRHLVSSRLCLNPKP